MVTADHGESLFDDGFLGHGHMLNEQQTRIPFILSAPGVAMPAVIGLADMRAIILRAAGADVPAPPRRGRSSSISAASTGRARSARSTAPAGGSIFNFFQETVWTSATGRWTRYADLPAGSAERRAADALIDEWARQRWLRHLRDAAS